jgi:hypothetical protein
MYTFDCRRADGTSVCLEAVEVTRDVAALLWARRVLRAHPTCEIVEVFQNERAVGSVRARAPRDPPRTKQGASDIR